MEGVGCFQRAVCVERLGQEVSLLVLSLFATVLTISKVQVGLGQVEKACVRPSDQESHSEQASQANQQVIRECIEVATERQERRVCSILVQ